MQINRIFNIKTDAEFNDFAINIFHYQYSNNPVYQEFVNFHLSNINRIDHYSQIPFLPIEFFKTHKVLCNNCKTEKIFTSSGTTGSKVSRHYISSLNIYEQSFSTCFRLFYGDPEQYVILALLPSYLEQKGSSLVYMVEKLIEQSKNKDSGFYLNNYDELVEKLKVLRHKKIILFGVTYALLDIAENYELDLANLIILETGGMKGRRKEIIREDLHQVLCERFNLQNIHSEYGMTELLSQAYSKGKGVFETPPWMKILIRDTNDPKTILGSGVTGGINMIDLANIYSCSFIATQDLGRIQSNGTFEILGRFDESDIRGCNLLVE